MNRVLGIVNGTTNYVLDRMDSAGSGFTEALVGSSTVVVALAQPTIVKSSPTAAIFNIFMGRPSIKKPRNNNRVRGCFKGIDI